MIAHRALFTSDENQDVRGYHLVARSGAIDDELAQKLSVLGPTHGSLDGGHIHSSSLNYCLVNHEWVVISRSALGGPEYSNRGSFRVVTTFLVVHEGQLSGFRNNPYVLTQVAQGLGYLSIRFPVTRHVDAVHLPEATMLARHSRHRLPSASPVVRQIAEALGESQPIAVIGAADPEAIITQLFEMVPAEMRLWLSYSTNLKPSINRPFRLQFCGPCDDHQMLGLEAKGFVCVRATGR